MTQKLIEIRGGQGDWKRVPCHSRDVGGLVIAEPRSGIFTVTSVVNGQQLGWSFDDAMSAKRCRRDLLRRFPNLTGSLRRLGRHPPTAPHQRPKWFKAAGAYLTNQDNRTRWTK